MNFSCVELSFASSFSAPYRRRRSFLRSLHPGSTSSLEKICERDDSKGLRFWYHAVPTHINTWVNVRRVFEKHFSTAKIFSMEVCISCRPGTSTKSLALDLREGALNSSSRIVYRAGEAWSARRRWLTRGPVALCNVW